eukprot:scaffold13567_cov217-Alexandrium_tamarense.AAC.1
MMLMGNEFKRNERNQIRRMPPCITSTRRFIMYLSTLYTFVRHQQRILMDLGKNSGRDVVILDGNTTKEESRLHHICQNNRGSLHQVALDMALHASQQQGSLHMRIFNVSWIFILGSTLIWESRYSG